MSSGEFDLIRRYFDIHTLRHPYNQLGIGDDCALLKIPDTCQLAVSADTMVENIHFFAGADPEQLGHKLLAVNLSDLAAMGAEPFAVTLCATLPKVDEDWLLAFSRGFFELARRYQVDLIGGDTTAGPLTLTAQVFGAVPVGQALLRSTANSGDLIYVSGPIGDAGLGLKIKQGYACFNPEAALKRFNTPMPRIEIGLALSGIASACIDISDGLAADLGHILTKSRVGACLHYASLPLSTEVRAYIAASGDVYMPLSAGDDYELCFTAHPDMHGRLPAGCHCIGVIEAAPGLRINRDGGVEDFVIKGYEHFK
ncbi:MAG: thiamine-phosphate kinase [Methylomonas sp.]|jgi:thiamine-monophosphate kinase